MKNSVYILTCEEMEALMKMVTENSNVAQVPPSKIMDALGTKELPADLPPVMVLNNRTVLPMPISSLIYLLKELEPVTVKKKRVWKVLPPKHFDLRPGKLRKHMTDEEVIEALTITAHTNQNPD